MAPPSRGKIGIFRRSPTKSPESRRKEEEHRITQEEQIDPGGREEHHVSLDDIENMETEDMESSRENITVQDRDGS